jgi:riboflavin synthase
MFTGLVSAITELRAVTARGDGLDLLFANPWTDVQLGESIAVNGACLTVAAITNAGFTVQVIATTLDRTTFGERRIGDRVNLERALAVGDRLGGHMVQGHVDGVGVVQSIQARGDAVVIELDLPPEVAAVSIPLGSITVDGVSLTINAITSPNRLEVALVPFTLQHTTLGDRQVGDHVQLEGDLVGKHLKQLAAVQLQARS